MGWALTDAEVGSIAVGLRVRVRIKLPCDFVHASGHRLQLVDCAEQLDKVLRKIILTGARKVVDIVLKAGFLMA